MSRHTSLHADGEWSAATPSKHASAASPSTTARPTASPERSEADRVDLQLLREVSAGGQDDVSTNVDGASAHLAEGDGNAHTPAPGTTVLLRNGILRVVRDLKYGHELAMRDGVDVQARTRTTMRIA